MEGTSWVAGSERLGGVGDVGEGNVFPWGDLGERRLLQVGASRLIRLIVPPGG